MNDANNRIRASLDAQNRIVIEGVTADPLVLDSVRALYVQAALGVAIVAAMEANAAAMIAAGAGNPNAAPTVGGAP